MNPANFVTNHPYQAMTYAFAAVNLIATMPSPNGVGIRGTTIYKWMFGFLHAINIPRLLITLFPQYAGAVGLISQADTADIKIKIGADKGKENA